MKRLVLRLGALSPVLMAGSALAEMPGTGDANVATGWWWIAPLASVLALYMAWHFYKSMMSANPGNEDRKSVV